MKRRKTPQTLPQGPAAPCAPPWRALALLCGLLLAATVALAQNPNTAVYPGQIATDQDLGVAADNPTTTLAQAIDNATLTIQVVNATDFPEKVILKIGSEEILICTIAGNTMTACAAGRGFNSTVAASHVAGATVENRISSHYINQLGAEMKSTEKSLGPVVAGASLPATPATGDMARVNNGNSGGGDPCQNFGGSDLVLCIYDGVNWTQISGAGGVPGADSVGTSQLDDGTDTPAAGEWVQVDPGDTSQFNYRSDAELLADAGAASTTHAPTHTVGGSDRIDVDGVDAGAATTRTNENKIQVSSHDTDCTSLTDGVAREICIEEDSERIFTCQPTAGGCDTPAEWILTGDGTGVGKTAFSLRAVPSADTLTTGDGKAETGNIPNTVAGKTVDRFGCHLDFAAVSATGTTTIVLHNMVSATDVATVTIAAGSQDGFTAAITGGLISEHDTFRFDIDTITSGGTTEKGASCYVEAA